MEPDQLRWLIISTLQEFDNFYTPEAVNLLMGTSAQESHLGRFIKQLGNGPALGIFQMEPATFKDIIDTYLAYRPKLLEQIMSVCNVQSLEPECLQYNLKVDIVFARLRYYRAPGLIPNTIEGMAMYWKEHYNTPGGKGTEEEFIANYKRFVA